MLARYVHIYMERCRGEKDLWAHTSYLHSYGIR